MIRNPLEDGACGDGATDDSAALNVCRATIRDEGGGVMQITRPHACNGTPLQIDCSDIHFNFATPQARLIAKGSSAFDLIECAGSEPTVEYPITTAMVEGGEKLITPAIAEFAPGDLLYIKARANLGGVDYHDRQFSDVLRKEGPALILSSPVCFPVYPGYATVSKVTNIRRNVTITNARLTGNRAPGAVGARLYWLRDSLIDGFQAEHIAEAGLMPAFGIDNEFARVRLTDCGSNGLADFEPVAQTNWRARDITSRHASGFGPTLVYCYRGQGFGFQQRGAGSTYASGPTGGRGIKMFGCAFNQWFGAISDCPTWVSFAFTGKSCNNVAYGVFGTNPYVAGTTPGNNEGIWFSDQYSKNNMVIGADLRNCGLYNVALWASDTGNQIIWPRVDGGANYIGAPSSAVYPFASS